MEWITAGIGVVGAVGALGAWWAAHRSAKLSETNIELTKALVTIDQDRRHEQLTPEFKVTCEQISEDHAKLRVELVGPLGLDRLDEVVVTIRNDTHMRGESPMAISVSAVEITRFLWSPYCLTPGVDGADQDGRKILVGKLFRGDWKFLALERTSPPYWVNDPGRWRREWSSKPLRILLTCRRGNATWEVPDEIFVTNRPTTVQPDPEQAHVQANALVDPTGR